MSGIFGIYNRDGQSVDNETTVNMLDGMSYWKPDNRGTWSHGSVALGHTMLWNTPESKLEHLPNKQDHLVITMDARLDNREELVKQLDLPELQLDHITDSDFILAAYHKWKEQCPKYLVGDFAFAIWDDREQHLFCARDHVGVKQLYFHLTDALCVFTNDLKGMVKHSDISEEINEEAIANFVINTELISPTLTFFKNAQKLPPAHSLTITATKIVKQCYWKAEDSPRVVLPNADAYAKKLRQLLELAVHARMRSDYPITSHLSGGLDSSTIAVLAARKLREKGKSLFAFNWLHEPTKDDDPTDYEWSNSKTIAEAEGINHSYVHLTAEDIYLHMKGRNIIYGNCTGFWYEYPVRLASQNKGARTILSGWGGDELATYHGQAYYSSLFSQGKIIQALKELRQSAQKNDKKHLRRLLSSLYHNIFLVFIPKSVYCHMPKTRCVRRTSFQFIKKPFLPTVKKEMKKPSVLTKQPQRTIRAHMLAFWQNGHLQSRIESWATAAISNRLEYGYPLLDKRIVEFILGVPAEYFVEKGTRRYLFRSASKQLIPQNILWANAKVERNRVQRLFLLVLSACKMFTADTEILDEQTDVIDTKKVKSTLEQLESSDLDHNILFLIKDIQASLSVILSMELCNKKLT